MNVVYSVQWKIVVYFHFASIKKTTTNKKWIRKNVKCSWFCKNRQHLADTIHTLARVTIPYSSIGLELILSVLDVFRFVSLQVQLGKRYNMELVCLIIDYLYADSEILECKEDIMERGLQFNIGHSLHREWGRNFDLILSASSLSLLLSLSLPTPYFATVIELMPIFASFLL